MVEDLVVGLVFVVFLLFVWAVGTLLAFVPAAFIGPAVFGGGISVEGVFGVAAVLSALFVGIAVRDGF